MILKPAASFPRRQFSAARRRLARDAAQRGACPPVGAHPPARAGGLRGGAQRGRHARARVRAPAPPARAGRICRSTDLQGNFLRLRLAGYTLKWERHTEFTRYSIVQPLPAAARLGATDPSRCWTLVVDAGLAARHSRAHRGGDQAGDGARRPVRRPQAGCMAPAQRWFGERTVVGFADGRRALVGRHRLPAARRGFERMLVIAPPGTSDTRAGRISQRLLELETYRLMALRGLPVAKSLAPMLAEAEAAAGRHHRAARKQAQASDQELLDTLVGAGRARRARHRRACLPLLGHPRLRRAGAPAHRRTAREGHPGHADDRRIHAAPAVAGHRHGGGHARSAWPRCRSASSAPARCCARGWTSPPKRRTSSCWPSSPAGRNCSCGCRARWKACRSRPSRTTWSACCSMAARPPRPRALPINPEIAAGALIPLVLWAVWRTIRRIHAKLHGGH